ncbi:MAG: hypothetical protein ACLQM6_09720 [Acidobacteriaceae bacterium]
MVKKGYAPNVLDTISTDDIVVELKRRIAKMDEAKTTLAALSGHSTAAPRAKNPNVSRAKEAYWRRRREWLAANPGKTMEDFYRENRRVLTFDTSVHNRLVKIGASSKPIYAAIKSRYFFRLAGLSFEEMVSTPQAADRLALLDGCRQLTAGRAGRAWDCLNPPYEILRILIAAHAKDPANFKWLAVDVRSGGLAHEIRTGELTADDALANLQRTEQNASIKSYKAIWVKLRDKLDPLFVAQNLPRPNTFDEAFKSASPSLFPGMGKGFYDAGLRFDAELRGIKIEPDTNMATVQHFIDNCLPFRALLCACLMTWYNTSLRDGNKSEKFAAGRNDLFMAVYMPYCDVFVTRDAEQETCLCELTKFIGIDTEVLSFDAFADELKRDRA